MSTMPNPKSNQLRQNVTQERLCKRGLRSLLKSEDKTNQQKIGQQCPNTLEAIKEAEPSDSNVSEEPKRLRPRFHRSSKVQTRKTLFNASGATKTKTKTKTKPSPKVAKSPRGVKRKRRMSVKVKEALMVATMVKEEHEIEMKRPKRSYNKRSNQKRTGNKTTDEKGGNSDEDISLDYENISCCVCNCVIDYSEREAFLWPSEASNETLEPTDRNMKKENDKNVNNLDKNEQSYSKLLSTAQDLKGCQTEGGFKSSKLDANCNGEVGESEKDIVVKSRLKIPEKMYDPENALLICDTPGCNRSFHQRCHFVPIFCIPKKQWYCLICQFKKELKNNKTIIRRKLQNGDKNPKDHHPMNVVLGKETYNALLKPLTKAEIDALYPVPRVPSLNDKSTKTKGDRSKIPDNSKPMNVTTYERFEFQSAFLKSTLLEKELSHRIKSTMDFNLGRIRQSQNTIRAYTETNRERKALLESYKKRNTFPQEFNQSILRMAESKKKIKGILESLERVIQNRNDRFILEKWFSQQVTEHNQVMNSKKPRQTSDKEGQVSREEVVSFSRSCKSSIEPLYIDSMFFTGPQRRNEPRFELDDYDGSEEVDVESTHTASTNCLDGEQSNVLDMKKEKETEFLENPCDKVKCQVCFSGFVGPDNDVIMCDGEKCFRAFHMQCMTPPVTQKMLDNDVNGTWFCPFCTCFANVIHYVEDEYFGDEKVCEHNYDNNSSISWTKADDVFPEADSELLVAKSLKEEVRNKQSEEYLSSLLGIEIGNGRGITKTLSFINDDSNSDSDDESDGDYSSNKNEGISVGTISSDDVSSVEWGIDRSEIAALSSDSSVDENSQQDSNHEDKDCPSSHAVKRRVHLRKCRLNPTPPTCGDECESENKNTKSVSDIGTFDEANIIHGKRKRTKVDYRRLNDALFGELTEAELVIGDDGEYTNGFKTKTEKINKIMNEDQSDNVDVCLSKRRSCRNSGGRSRKGRENSKIAKLQVSSKPVQEVEHSCSKNRRGKNKRNARK